MDLIPPPAPASSAVPFRDWLGGGHTSEAGSFNLDGVGKPPFKVALPDIEVRAITLEGPIVSEDTSTSLMGDFTLQHFSPPQNGVLPVGDLGIRCLGEGINIFRCFGLDPSFKPIPDEVIDQEANQTNRINLITTSPSVTPNMTFFTGSVLLEDGSPCGTENEFFGITSTASIDVTDIDGNLIHRVHANSGRAEPTS